jgi:hypothetical protein
MRSSKCKEVASRFGSKVSKEIDKIKEIFIPQESSK